MEHGSRNDTLWHTNLSNFFPSVWFGLFTALAMLISQLATLTMLPSLFLVTGYPRKRG